MSFEVRKHARITPIAAFIAVALSTAPVSVRAEASHHVPSAGQIVSPSIVSDVRSLTDPDPARWNLEVFQSVLVSTGAFDDHGMRADLVGADRITLMALSAHAERRFGPRWAVSATTSFQRLSVELPQSSDTLHDLGDTLLSARHSDVLPFGSLSIAATVRVPGTYPDSAVTSSKQVDAEGKLILAVPAGRHVTLAGGAGYKLRLGSVEDEVTAYVVVPVQLSDAWTITGNVVAGIPIGFGVVAKNVVMPGVTLEWLAPGHLAVSASYQRSVWGRNVADVDAFALGVGRAF
jgi:hypothetical protein